MMRDSALGVAERWTKQDGLMCHHDYDNLTPEGVRFNTFHPGGVAERWTKQDGLMCHHDYDFLTPEGVRFNTFHPGEIFQTSL